MSLHGTQRALEAAGLSPDFGYDRGNDDNYRWEREPALYSQPFSRSGSPSRVGAALDRERRREAQIVQEQQQTSSLLASIQNMIGGQGFDTFMERRPVRTPVNPSHAHPPGFKHLGNETFTPPKKYVDNPPLFGSSIDSGSRVALAATERQRQQQALERQQQEQTNSLMSRIQKMVGGEGFDALKGYSPSPQDIGMGIGSAMLPMGLGLAMPALKGLNQFVGDAFAPSLEGLSPDERQKVIDRVENSTTVGNSVTGPDYQFQGRLSLDDTFGYLDRPNEDKQGNFLNTVREFVNNPTFAGSQGIDQGNLDANLLQGFRTQGRDAIRGAFPGNAFQLDSDIIASIVGERRTNASTEVANFAARGNIGPQGSLAANQDLTRQAEGATTRLGEIGAGVLGGFQQNINDIRDRATFANQEFRLGDDLFDVTPFADERSQLITDRTPTIRSGILSALGSERLFDIPSTLGLAGRAQGNVSGVRNNNALLDQIANRQTTQSSRGLGTRGSGAF